MAGSKQTPPTPVPTALTVRKQSRVLEIAFDDGAEYSLPFELLRVYSPSAEVRGHGTGQEVLQTGKRDILLTALEPVGNYAVQPNFSDGHNTGIYSWDYLYWLGKNQDKLWEDYLTRLEAAGFTRESGRDAPQGSAGTGGSGCGHSH
ncbi:MAG: 1-(5-phosphoribosyl)-5-((5-phosphoribosylamino)methylideneamino)imidazole-4-carboxamide isomerase [Burkholderiales bacterium RIFCSPLOWO2_02_FULL_57_36]|nr:MAG: 1-(5-phosphoribosyl)-5-((5-phosphoribosylamino)methylideneamino)imidazole-4-carboxamide isomerase [Burkholderiales bacterium RIFCSPLOWO2_02_FULL_57_36]